MRLKDIRGLAEVNECKLAAHPGGSWAASVWGLNFCRPDDDHHDSRQEARDAVDSHNGAVLALRAPPTKLQLAADGGELQ